MKNESSTSEKTLKNNDDTRNDNRGMPLILLEWYALFLTFLLPLKFGSIAVMPEVPLLYVDNLFAWFIISWPTLFFPVASGFLLLFASLRIFPNTEFTSKLKIVMIWTGLAFVSLLGFINASCYIYPVLQCIHLFGIAAYGVGIYMIVTQRPGFKKMLVSVIVISTIISCLSGWYQLFAGFEETRNFVYQQELRSGIKYAGNFHNRLMQSRVFANFSLCNSFAAHLILTIPLCFWLVWHLCGKVDPPGITRLVFVPILVLLTLPMLYYTYSRAAILALGGALLLMFVFLPFNRKIRIGFLGVILVFTGLGILLLNSGRGMASITIRFDYYLQAVRMFFEKPFFGTGWGDFFHQYTYMKQFIVEGATHINNESPHTPHNIVLAFAAQTGIIGLITVILAFIYPTAVLFSVIRKNYLKWCEENQELCGKFANAFGRLVNSGNSAILLGWLAWCLHSLSDINLQVPGTVATALAMLLSIDFTFEELPKVEASGVRVGKGIFYPFWYAVVVLLVFATLFIGLYQIRGDYAFYKLRDMCDYRNKPREEFVTVTPAKMKEAFDLCRRYIPYSPFPWATAGDFISMHGRFDIAENYYKEASALSPERASFYFRLYLVQARLGKYDEANRNLKKAQELFPAHSKYSEAPELKQ